MAEPTKLTVVAPVRVRAKKHRVFIDPSNLLPFEVTDEAKKYYSQDEYKYLIHYFRAFPEGRVPVAQYLLIRFHPLLIKLCGHYVKALNMEWRDLISFARQRFIELLYRFNLNSSLYFRTYIQTALRRAIYDRVLFESRRKLLYGATSLDELRETNGDTECKELVTTPEFSENYEEIVEKLVEVVNSSDSLAASDKEIFRMRFIENLSLQEICVVIGKPSFYTVARLRAIKETLAEHIKENF